MTERHRNALPAGYQLHWYEILEVLGQGGFGMTYLARDSNLNHQVAIKEYLPAELVQREQDCSLQVVNLSRSDEFDRGMQRFMVEARTLACFRHPNIIRVLTTFEANNTAYMAMEYEQGRSLRQILKKCRTLSLQDLLRVVLPIMEGLEQVHEGGFIHRDVKPDNIFLRTDHSPVLLDFGSARQSTGGTAQTLTAMVTPGYAPFEQYHSGSEKQGPWSDIYGLAATMYRAISGVAPLDAIERSNALIRDGKDNLVSAAEIGEGKYPAALLQAIDHGLAFREEDRPQSILEWRHELADVIANADTVKLAPGNPVMFGIEPVRPRSQTASQAVETTQILITEKEAAEDREQALALPSELTTLKNHHQFNQARSGSHLSALSGALSLSLLAVFIFFMVSRVDPVNRTATEGLSASVQQSVPEKVTDALGQRITIQQLLQQADGYLREHRLSLPPGDNAYELYRQILLRDKDNPQAMAGQTRVMESYRELIAKTIEHGELGQASEYLHRADALLDQHPALAEVRIQLSAAKTEAQKRETTDARIDRLLQLAESDLQAGRYSQPAGRNAREKYQQILRLRKGHTGALAGLQKIEGLPEDGSQVEKSITSAQQFWQRLGGREAAAEDTRDSAARMLKNIFSREL